MKLFHILLLGIILIWGCNKQPTSNTNNTNTNSKDSIFYTSKSLNDSLKVIFAEENGIKTFYFGETDVNNKIAKVTSAITRINNSDTLLNYYFDDSNRVSSVTSSVLGITQETTITFDYTTDSIIMYVYNIDSINNSFKLKYQIGISNNAITSSQMFKKGRGDDEKLAAAVQAVLICNFVITGGITAIGALALGPVGAVAGGVIGLHKAFGISGKDYLTFIGKLISSANASQIDFIPNNSPSKPNKVQINYKEILCFDLGNQFVWKNISTANSSDSVWFFSTGVVKFKTPQGYYYDMWMLEFPILKFTTQGYSGLILNFNPNQFNTDFYQNGSLENDIFVRY